MGLTLGLIAGYGWTRYAANDKALTEKANAKWQAKKAELRKKAEQRAQAASVAAADVAPASLEEEPARA